MKPCLFQIFEFKPFYRQYKAELEFNVHTQNLLHTAMWLNNIADVIEIIYK